MLNYLIDVISIISQRVILVFFVITLIKKKNIEYYDLNELVNIPESLI